MRPGSKGRAEGWVAPPSPRGDVKCSRANHSAVALGGKIFVFGGRDRFDALAKPFSDVLVLNLSSNTWRALHPRGPSPPARCESRRALTLS